MEEVERGGDKSLFSSRVNECLKDLTILSKRKRGKMLLYFSELPTQTKKSPTHTAQLPPGTLLNSANPPKKQADDTRRY